MSIYNSEVAIGSPYYAPDYYSIDSSGYIKRVLVSMDNLDYWKQLSQQDVVVLGVRIPQLQFLAIINSDWYKVQSFRRDTYIELERLLQQYGIDRAFVDASIA